MTQRTSPHDRPADKFLRALEAGGHKWNAHPSDTTRWTAQCPAHPDATPSLSLREEADGRLLVNCFAGCGTGDVLHELGLSFADLYPAGSQREATLRKAARTASVGQVVDAFQRWLHLPDPLPLYAVLGTVAANRLEGDPVWLVIVGPPGGGKSELLQATAALPDVYAAATLTEAALLSGTPKRETASGAKGGLLREIGDFGIVVCKDFGSVLNMNRDARAAVLAALREVYDGSWTRHVGTDGGRSLHWSGKVGLLAGCTPTIDRHHAVMGAMGERFVLLRLSEGDGDEQARRALAHAGRERQMRAELRDAVAGLFVNEGAEPREPSEDERERLVLLASLVVRSRSAVERDGYSRDVELVPDAEAPTRLVVVLSRLLAGLDTIGVDRTAAWQVITRAALDSIPALRRAVMDALHTAGGELATTAVAEAVSYPTQTTRRALEDLTAHGIVRRVTQGQGKADTWALSEWAGERYSAALTVPDLSEGVSGETVPEMSEDVKNAYLNTNTAFDDFSGKVTEPHERAVLSAVGAAVAAGELEEVA